MAARTSADLALVGARIRTLDPDRPTATAVAMRAGTIIAVGSDAEVRAACDGATEVIDLAGAAVVPGLADSHIHPFLRLRRRARRRPDRGAHPGRGAATRCAAERARCGDGAWVRGYALAYEAFPDGGIDGRLIEEAVGGSPGAAQLLRLPHGAGVARGAARAGVDGPREFTEAAEVVCVDGAPTGELRETGAIGLVMRGRTRAGPTRSACSRYRATFERLNAVGLTGAPRDDRRRRSCSRCAASSRRAAD